MGSSDPKICLCFFSPAKHHRQALQAFRRGLKAHGVTPIESDCMNGVPDCDLAVFWGHSPQFIIERQQATGRDYLVMERGYIGDRMQWTSLGFNGLNGRAQFYADDSPGDRWGKYFGDEWLKPWKRDGKYILLCGQVPGDASVRHIGIHVWARYMAECLRGEHPAFPIRYRPHPIEVQRRRAVEIKGAEFSTRPLEEDLGDAMMAVTFNSNVGVDALIAGVPALAYDKGSMVYRLASHEAAQPLQYPDRRQWARDMAYCQWSWSEIESGEAWEHLRQRYQINREARNGN